MISKLKRNFDLFILPLYSLSDRKEIKSKTNNSMGIRFENSNF
ncbi:hypothetical protein LEP1GSC137_1711 [Leptospira borgpetersenii str. Noumea 25]|nr:hypothetical protein LEP1GSC121_3323 [Leptospira borgpetersenii serovar Castellonis str. 200801910]EMO07915.1 hypothetical protein LEP1GSC137_1711 [Leptospira borgpetersenii str. Noumea 25]